MYQRTCDCCKKEILMKKNSEDIIYFDKKYYHKQCFLDACQRKSTKANASPKWGMALANIDSVIIESQDYINNVLIKDDIFQFMLDFYGVSNIPRNIFQRLDAIYKGEFVGMTIGIPPMDLLDMWKRRRDYLNKIHMQNKSKGKNMDTYQLIAYDLSVLINKYDSYLRWKEHQKIIEQENTIVHSKILQEVDLKNMGKQVLQNKKENNSEDIDDLLDELFN